MKILIKKQPRYLSFSVFLIMIPLMFSCGVSNLVVEGSFPTPNINKIPLTMAVYYDETLKEFSYMEYSETGREEINVESGQSHINLFNAVLPAMFDEVIEIEGFDDPKALEVDAVFAPVIEEFQLALPEKTKLEVYEVWIKYNMRIVDSSGDSLADWVVTSYGKTPTETFRSIEDGINEATVVALRDLASSFSLNFTRIPEVQDWLNNL
ncbi:MAG: hypothetical protein CMM37_10460 [Rhodospirillaceae bacterium]|nr:hypothetical protein [Rhodospirillaceae bacterium]